MVTALVGCTSVPDAGPSAADPGVHLTVQVAGEPEETAAYEAVAAAFMKSRPDVDVEVIDIADKDDHLARLTTSFAGGDAPDVFLVNYREYAQFVTRGAIAPIQDRLDELEIDLGAYFPPPLYAFTYDDRLQCMPQNVSSLVVYYNETLFERAGLKRPPRDWRWVEFEDVARRLTTGDVRGVGIEPSIIRLAPFVWSNGGELTDDPEQPTRFTLEEPRAREALEFLVSLAREGLVPTEEEIAAQDLETRFVTGKLGMYLSSRRDTPVFREVAGFRFDVAPLPVSRQPAGILHSDAYCVSAGGDDIDAAFEFVAFATGRQGQTIASLAGRTVPSLRAVARSSAFLDPTRPPRHAEVFLDALEGMRRTPVLPTWPEIEDVAEEILTRAFYEGDYPVDEAIRALHEATAPLFAEAAGS